MEAFAHLPVGPGGLVQGLHRVLAVAVLPVEDAITDVRIVSDRDRVSELEVHGAIGKLHLLDQCLNKSICLHVSINKHANTTQTYMYVYSIHIWLAISEHQESDPPPKKKKRTQFIKKYLCVG